MPSRISPGLSDNANWGHWLALMVFTLLVFVDQTPGQDSIVKTNQARAIGFTTLEASGQSEAAAGIGDEREV